MRKERITDVLSGLDARYIEEAANYQPIQHRMIWQWVAGVAACLALAIGIGFLVNGNRQQGIGPYPIKHVEVLPSEDAGEIGRVPHWGELHVTSKFGEFEHPLGTFTTGAKAIDGTCLGASMGRVSLQGYDVYTDTKYTAEGETYAINGVSTDFALALHFDGEDKYYVYRNTWYRPTTLGELIDALALEEHLTSKTVYYRYQNDKGESAKIEFEGLTTDRVWEMLLSDRTLKNVYDQKKTYVARMSVSVSVSILGYDNIGIWVTDDGYLVTNIGSTGKAFYLGVERVNAFVDYVMQNCQGYEIIYSYPAGYEAPESGEDLYGFTVTSEASTHK